MSLVCFIFGHVWSQVTDTVDICDRCARTRELLLVPMDCTRQAGHEGPCNGFSVPTCPGYNPDSQ